MKSKFPAKTNYICDVRGENKYTDFLIYRVSGEFPVISQEFFFPGKISGFSITGNPGKSGKIPDLFPVCCREIPGVFPKNNENRLFLNACSLTFYISGLFTGKSREFTGKLPVNPTSI